MKKILFGSAAAICAVIGLSAFKTTKPATGPLYWFKAIPNFTAGTNPSGLFNVNVTYFTVASVSTLSASPCLVGTKYDCIIGFTKAQVVTTATPVKLKTSPTLHQDAQANDFIRN